ncbi:C40 family peptidase [Candidatus Mycobacterium methanotrophicum]|uniref:C40 family peptidase n=1 Tax=Candidatus Mycobacterium methanotrophicum TaxID=2943498 RepID=A0ABY4QM83_9MYCO|nr:C40 family peptidase [Candidatus Mycobacterium methanotrophicum]UQX11056.1 C40 family peptidase [Candidatus Mycobacterium methanotrophicum]
MTGSELAALSRAHQLFAGTPGGVTLDPDLGHYDSLLRQAAALNTGGGQELYRSAVDNSRASVRSAVTTDAALATTTTQAHHDHATARTLTRNVLDEARADTATPATPMAQREAVRRRVARLRAQHAHVLSARQQARRHWAALRALRYRALRRPSHRPGLRLPPATTRAGIAVRAALSRLGSPYVWGATGPDRFDCSGLTQWSYARAGIHLDRTTYQQIYDGIPVPRSQVRPGDLVFPSAGHVQMAIGDNLVVEAPHAGATVRISPLGSGVQIRRPVG